VPLWLLAFGVLVLPLLVLRLLALWWRPILSRVAFGKDDLLSLALGQSSVCVQNVSLPAVQPLAVQREWCFPAACQQLVSPRQKYPWAQLARVKLSWVHASALGLSQPWAAQALAWPPPLVQPTQARPLLAPVLNVLLFFLLVQWARQKTARHQKWLSLFWRVFFAARHPSPLILPQAILQRVVLQQAIQSSPFYGRASLGPLRQAHYLVQASLPRLLSEHCA
jgi:hypothetical protein